MHNDKNALQLILANLCSDARVRLQLESLFYWFQFKAFLNFLY